MQRRFVLLALASAALFVLPQSAYAQEAQPGDACTTNGAVRSTGGPEQMPRRMLICNGTTWQSALEQTTAGASLLQIGNDTGSCTTAKLGRMRYNGTSTWEYCNGSTWTALGGGSTSAAGADREIQFNSGGAFGASPGLKFMPDRDFLIESDLTDPNFGTASVPFSSAPFMGMFFDAQTGALRMGVAQSNEWDNANVGGLSVAMGGNVTASGDGSFALGQDSVASGSGSFALGRDGIASGLRSFVFGNRLNAEAMESLALGSNANATGTASIALGLINGTIDPPSQRPTVSGVGSMGVFMGDQYGVTVAQNDQLSVLGGKMVIDPASPATNLSADTALEVAGTLKIGSGGEACDAAREGSIRYLAASDTFETCATAGSWTALGGGGAALSDLTAATATNTIANANFTQNWNWDTLTTGNGLSLGSSSLTTGNVLYAAATNTAASGSAIYATTNSTTNNAAAVEGVATGASGRTYGLYGTTNSAATGAAGIFAWAYGASAATYGGNFGTDSTSGIGVRGQATATTGSTMGGFFRTDSTGSAYGVYGEASAGTGPTMGGYFDSASTSGTGVYGNASASSGTTYGLYGRSASTGGYGGYFTNTHASGGWGLYSTDDIGLAANMYLNWGTTRGSGGYGIRDNAGTIECKNSGGAWAACAGGGGSAAGSDREIQFNNSGAFGASSTFKLMADGDLLLSGAAATGVSSVPLSGAGTRMFFDIQQAAFRAGEVNGTQWDNASIGPYSVAMGYNTTASAYNAFAAGYSTTASGDYSTALGYMTTASGSTGVALGNQATASDMASFASGFNTMASGNSSTAMGRNVIVGNGTGGSGQGDGSMAIGLMDDGVIISNRPQVTGIQSMGIFMGDQDGLVLSTANQMSLLGGKMVIDSTVPATNLVADTELEIDGTLKIGSGGESCDASREGSIQYLAASDTFQVCATAGSWSAMGGGASLSGLTAATADNSINNANFEQNWGWNSLTTGVGLSLYSTSVTSGTVLAVSANNTGTSGVIGSAIIANNNSRSDYSNAIEANAGGLSGITTGVYGSAASPNGTGVEGYTGSGASSGVGVKGRAGHTSGLTRGVLGEVSSTSGTGVFGNATAATGSVNGVQGYVISTSGTGVRGTAAATSGTTYGVYGTNASSAGYGGYFTNTSTGVALHAAGDIEFTGALRDMSDIRLKDNIQPIDRTLEKIIQLDGLSYTMKDSKIGTVEYGFSAQDVQKIFPNLVHTAPDEMGTLSLNYQGMIAPMVEAMKEQQTEIDSLRAEINELKSAIESMKKDSNE